MATNQELIDKLIEKLELLFKKQAEFSSEIDRLKQELYQLKNESVDNTARPQKEDLNVPPLSPSIEASSEQEVTAEMPKEQMLESISETEYQMAYVPVNSETRFNEKPKSKSSLEKFIGENILSKIGVIILIIGVAIGAKYSIENDLISPTTRIILGYLTAIGLLGFGIKLKKKYDSYSAVLVSGSIVILYFITFFAYSFYALLPQLVTFALMVIFTTFTIVAAINYNRQVIAHIGLVGAYAVPFLLSDDSGKVEVLFSYIAIINIGILIISFKKYWKSLYYAAFIFTWLIFSSWIFFDYDYSEQYYLALAFLMVFFFIFYITFIAYKLIKKEVYNSSDVILLLLNSFIFYGLGYSILIEDNIGEQLLGLFTLSNAVIHFIVSVLFYRLKLGDKKLFYLASALVMVFITITIPVQLNGNWVTLLWVTEAALLFWMGRTKSIAIYEKLSYPLMILAFLSLIEDWSNAYNSFYGYDIEEIFTVIFNIQFLSSMLFVAAFGFILWIQRKANYVSGIQSDTFWSKLWSVVVPAIFILSTYFAFRLEIDMYWDQEYHLSAIHTNLNGDYGNTTYNRDLIHFKTIWLLNYSLVFMAILAYVSIRFTKHTLLEKIAIIFNVITILLFLSQGLYAMSELRESYLSGLEYFAQSSYHLWIRYVSFIFLALAIFTCYKFIKRQTVTKSFKIAYDILLHLSLIWVLSSELIHWLDIGQSSSEYKLGLSILWGVYSFLLIAFGIWKDKAYLRIGGMIFFGITLIKLFFYDIVHLNTISKTIVFVSLGVLLLITSFLYNKFKNKITNDVNH
ncbi:DUF2339 domain-containing protein [Winogradskyella sediminis]|uniref:DUF2339 domain-containing protein n=1 Tax=Winogradskyella sediminis TaxID=1382466 RepID=UPI003AA80D13